MKTRYYDPEAGRFISQDGVEYLDPDAINGLNLYAYCVNNPVMNVDPNGTSVIGAILLIIGISALVVGAGVAIYAGVTAYNNGVRGWDLVGAIAEGFLTGAVIGAIIGGIIAMIIYAPQIVGSFLSSIGSTGFALAGGGTAAVAISVAEIAVVGLTAIAAMNIMFAQWEPGSWPGDDPTIAPGDDFIWRGPGEKGSSKGEWYNPKTGDQLHPDLNHPLPKGPHWGWRNKILKILQDIFK